MKGFSHEGGGGNVPVPDGLVEGSGSLEGGPKVDDRGDVPVAERLVEGACVGEKTEHGGGGGNVPVPDGLVEGGGVEKDLAEVGDRGNVPSADVLVEGGPVPEGFRHIRYLGNVPVADVPVGDGGVRFVGEPQVHRVLKVGVGQSGLGLFQVVEGQDFGRRKGPVVNADVVDGTMKIKIGW